MRKIISYKKGEATIEFENETLDEISIVFHANTSVPIKNTLHFGIKPGHILIYAKRRDHDEGHWILSDPGYLNYFRPENEDVLLTSFNTISKQKLLTKGKLHMVDTGDNSVKLISKTLFPYHKRVVDIEDKDTEVEITISDEFIGRSSIYWNFDWGFEEQISYFNNQKTIIVN